MISIVTVMTSASGEKLLSGDSQVDEIDGAKERPIVTDSRASDGAKERPARASDDRQRAMSTICRRVETNIECFKHPKFACSHVFKYVFSAITASGLRAWHRDAVNAE